MRRNWRTCGCNHEFQSRGANFVEGALRDPITDTSNGLLTRAHIEESQRGGGRSRPQVQADAACLRAAFVVFDVTSSPRASIVWFLQIRSPSAMADCCGAGLRPAAESERLTPPVSVFRSLGFAPLPHALETSISPLIYPTPDRFQDGDFDGCPAELGWAQDPSTIRT